MFFQILFDAKESLLIHSGLLFKLRFPKRGEKFNICLVLEQQDAIRKMTSMHAQFMHRGFMVLLAVFSKSYYTTQMTKLAYDVVLKCPSCAQFRPRPKQRVERLNISTRCLTFALDHKGPLFISETNKKPYYVLACVEINFRIVNFSLARTTTAAETARLLFENVVCYYGAAVQFQTDRAKSFINELMDALMILSGSLLKVSNAYRPAANFAEERAVRKLSSAIRATAFGGKPDDWSKSLKYLQLLLNSSYIGTYESQTPFSLVFGSENSFFHPLLMEVEKPLPYNEFWKERINKLKLFTKLLKEKYDIFLSQKSNKRQTVYSLNLKIGELVWARLFKYSPKKRGFSQVLPKFKLCRVEKILGATSLMVRDVETKMLISRHLQDIYKVHLSGSYSNLFQNSLKAKDHEVEENFSGVPVEEIPKVDGLSLQVASKQVDDELPLSKREKESQAANWKARLRPRKKPAT